MQHLQFYRFRPDFWAAIYTLLQIIVIMENEMLYLIFPLWRRQILNSLRTLESINAFITQIEWVFINDNVITDIICLVLVLYVFNADLNMLFCWNLHRLRENILILRK